MHRPSLDLAEPSRNLEESIGSPSAETTDPEVDLSITPPAETVEATDGVHGDDVDLDADDDDGRIFTPPPHIAARLFYRPTNQTRRKDSAASSRRNSISSVPSRSSHGCGARAGDGAPQSKYVAQHLRRASILEDRKARLADRAAHAEKVRLRAALARAAAKQNTSVSEERALAATQARERNLAEIAAACAEEVKRAKAVAESMKEKREQEIQKMRLQMEERHAEAERRREELRSRNANKGRGRERGQSLMARKPALVEVLPQVKEVKERDSSPMREDVAVSKIQWWWRGAMRRKAVTEFSELRLTIDGVRETSFERVTETLSQERVLVLTARVLRLCGLREGDTGSVNEMAAVRSFLSAFLILGHPAQVLSNKEGKGEQEQVGAAATLPIPRDDLANPHLQDLVGKARDLLIFFENILSRLTSLNNYMPPPTLLGQFPEVYATFYNAFIAWKARDSSSLVELMVMQFVELDAILETVSNNADGSVDEVYQKSVKDNQALLFVRIKRLAGPNRARDMVLEAVRKARKARAKAKKPTGDTKPRVAEQADQVSTDAMEGLATNDHANTQLQTPTPPATPSRKNEMVKVGVHIGGIKGLLPDNRIVVHELAINREFRIEPYEYRQQREQILAPLFDGMRKTMQADNQEGHFTLLLKIYESIKERLQRLVKPGNSMHAFIGELLDTDMAQRQFSSGSFSYERFFHAMGSLLPKLCAPVRDEEVKSLVENNLSQGNYVDRLEALMGFIDVMLSDYANYLLQIAAPAIVESATPYEAKIFTAGVETGKHDLSVATSAWRAARQKMLTEASRRDPEGINHPRSRPTPNKIYSQMLVDVFTQLSPPAEAEMPEMLRLDHKRAGAMAHMTRKIIVAGAILLQCKNLLKRDTRAPWKNEASRIIFVLEKAEESIESASEPGSSSSITTTPDVTTSSTIDGVMAALEAGRSMPAATKTHLRALVTKFVSAGNEAALRRDAEPREPVLRLLVSRLRGHVFARLAAASASEKVKVASTAGEKLAGLGLAEFVEKIRDMVDELGRVGVVDRDAHGVWWDRVAEVVEGEVGDGATASSSSSS